MFSRFQGQNREEEKKRGKKKGMEIKANFIAIKLGSGIHQFLGKISNQGKSTNRKLKKKEST